MWPPRISGGYLQFVFGRRDQIADQDGEEIIINHRAVIVAAHSTAALAENGAPEKYRAGQRDDTEQRPQEIIPAIHEGVLQSEVEDTYVFLQMHTRRSVDLSAKPPGASQGKRRAIQPRD